MTTLEFQRSDTAFSLDSEVPQVNLASQFRNKIELNWHLNKLDNSDALGLSENKDVKHSMLEFETASDFNI